MPHVFYFSLLSPTCPFSVTDSQQRNCVCSISTFRRTGIGISSTGSITVRCLHQGPAVLGGLLPRAAATAGGRWPAHRPWEGLSWFLQRAPCPQDALCYLTAELHRGPGARDAAIWRGVSLSSSMGLPQRLPPAEGQATAGLLLTTERCLTTTDHWLVLDKH